MFCECYPSYLFDDMDDWRDEIKNEKERKASHLTERSIKTDIGKQTVNDGNGIVGTYNDNRTIYNNGNEGSAGINNFFNRRTILIIALIFIVVLLSMQKAAAARNENDGKGSTITYNGNIDIKGPAQFGNNNNYNYYKDRDDL